MKNKLNITVVRYPGYPQIFKDQYEVVIELSIPKLNGNLKDAVMSEIEDMWENLFVDPVMNDDINLKEEL